MWKWIGTGSVLIGIASCGSGAAGPATHTRPDTFVEGSRLKARWVQAPGAPRVLAGWYDTELGVNCEFSSAYYRGAMVREGGGDLYCLPARIDGPGDLFGDPGCTQVVVDVPCADSRFVVLPSSDTQNCAALNRFFQVGDAVSSTSVYRNDGTSCVAVGSSRPLLAAHELGAELSIDRFVRAQLVVDAAGGRITRRILRASDGSSQGWDGWDNTRAEVVFPPGWGRPDENYPLGKWEPERVVDKGTSDGLFADASCSTAAGSYEGCGAAVVKSLFSFETSACSEKATYYDAAWTVTASEIHDGGPGACAAVFPGGPTFLDQRFVAVGPAVPSSSLADVRRFEDGAEQVRLRSAGSAAGPIGVTRYDQMFDTRHGMGCFAVPGADGRLRCHSDMVTGDTYADAGCTVRVLARSNNPSCAADNVPAVIGMQEVLSFDACGVIERRHAFPVGAVHAGAVFSLDATTGTCAPLGADIRATVVAYELGDELPPGDFVELATSDPF
jgi:hypothetical protein